MLSLLVFRNDNSVTVFLGKDKCDIWTIIGRYWSIEYVDKGGGNPHVSGTLLVYWHPSFIKLNEYN